MVGIYSATGKVAFVFDSVVLYIEQIYNRGIILRDDDLSLSLYMPTTVCRWRTENIRRRHNYLPLIMELFRLTNNKISIYFIF